MNPAFTVSALVVSYFTGPRLHECLYGLASDPDISEIILVDNGNTDEEVAWIDAFAARTDSMRVIRNGDNPGFGTAVNRAAARALGEMILVINPDAVIRRGSIAPMVAAMADHVQPVIVGGKIFDVQGKEERGGRRQTLTLARAMGLSKWNLNNDPPPSGPIEVGAISGAFFLMQRKAFRALGGFDEEYFLHVEDVDLCRQITERGGKVIYQPLAGALHYGSTSEVSSDVVRFHKVNGLKRYFRKYARTPLEKTLVALAMPFVGMAISLKK